MNRHIAKFRGKRRKNYGGAAHEQKSKLVVIDIVVERHDDPSIEIASLSRGMICRRTIPCKCYYYDMTQTRTVLQCCKHSLV